MKARSQSVMRKQIEADVRSAVRLKAWRTMRAQIHRDAAPRRKSRRDHSLVDPENVEELAHMIEESETVETHPEHEARDRYTEGFGMQGEDE